MANQTHLLGLIVYFGLLTLLGLVGLLTILFGFWQPDDLALSLVFTAGMAIMGFFKLMIALLERREGNEKDRISEQGKGLFFIFSFVFFLCLCANFNFNSFAL
ncbi:MAG: hypothetical protein GF365_03805 [Candidatus Buchananbacteria bacterium]|nr:hypothetical protein [Candidatus Buchananbacteria bacterium]